jgi:hypothetical protein
MSVSGEWIKNEGDEYTWSIKIGNNDLFLQFTAKSPDRFNPNEKRIEIKHVTWNEYTENETGKLFYGAWVDNNNYFISSYINPNVFLDKCVTGVKNKICIFPPPPPRPSTPASHNKPEVASESEEAHDPAPEVVPEPLPTNKSLLGEIKNRGVNLKSTNKSESDPNNLCEYLVNYANDKKAKKITDLREGKYLKTDVLNKIKNSVIKGQAQLPQAIADCWSEIKQDGSGKWEWEKEDDNASDSDSDFDGGKRRSQKMSKRIKQLKNKRSKRIKQLKNKRSKRIKQLKNKRSKTRRNVI